ncbi:type 4a pilus biogenesis protein PilO [Moorella sulfitireducens]|uniref:type 4a pilus biogenesis protein PilO n=1 Tax=Neomoorella sulfitireducens TaxID=2972948 RepID=UPI0021ABFC15|nr:type 4a pilus biogenesis protein PilO [Moorella sulfitireducens]
MKLKNYQFNRREKILLVLLAVVMGIIFFNKVVLGMQLPVYRELQGRLKTGRERLATAEQLAASAAGLVQKAEQAREEWDATRLHLGFTLGGTAPFLEAAQPRDRSLQVLAFRPLPVEKKDPFRVYPYEVTISGPYPALHDYISQLESLPALTYIRNLKILAREEKTGTVEGSFVIDLYDLGEGNLVPGLIALFPAGRDDGFAPPAVVVAAGEGAEGAGVSTGRGEAAGSSPASSSKTATSGPVPQNLPSAPPSPPLSAGNPGTTPLNAGEPPQYTLPRLVKDGLVPGPPYQDPPDGAGVVWLEELRVLRNVGPFFLLDRPAALAGMHLARSSGVYLSKEQKQAELKVDLQKQFIRLRGFIGIDDSFANSSGVVKVDIFADDRQLYQGEIRPGDYPQFLDLSFTVVRQLTFRLEWQAGGIGEYDQLLATLASLRFYRKD